MTVRIVEGFEMLVLTRRQNESLLIGDNVMIKIISCNGDKVRIAVEAPLSVRVLRSELAEKVTDGGTVETGAKNAR